MRLWEDSPLAYVDKIKTPTLIIHSELDFRVPVSQAEELHRALMRRGVPTLFIRFPDEGHDLSRTGQPLHRRDRLDWMVRWFRRYLAQQLQ
jgi:dipeptidyl aminopeptidase/acylaminoacyl peptidase